MKLIDLVEEKDDSKKGTYAGVRFSKETIDGIKEYIKRYSKPHKISQDAHHAVVQPRVLSRLRACG